MRKYHQADRSEEDQGAVNSLLSPGRRDGPRLKIWHSTKGNMGFPNLFASHALREKIQLGRKMRSVLKFDSQG